MFRPFIAAVSAITTMPRLDDIVKNCVKQLGLVYLSIDCCCIFFGAAVNND